MPHYQGTHPRMAGLLSSSTRERPIMHSKRQCFRQNYARSPHSPVGYHQLAVTHYGLHNTGRRIERVGVPQTFLVYSDHERKCIYFGNPDICVTIHWEHRKPLPTAVVAPRKFSEDSVPLPTRSIHYKICLTDPKPFCVPLYRYYPKKRRLIYEQIGYRCY